MNVREKRNEVLGSRIVKALESRNMEAYYVKTKEEALAKALELIPEGGSVSWGGSMSGAELRCIPGQRQRAQRGRDPGQHRWKREPCGGLRLRPENGSADRRYEQGGQDRGRCHEPRKK